MSAKPKSKKRTAAKRMKKARQTPAQLEAAIERVVRMAQAKETGVDVLHDHRRPFPHHGLSARRIG